MFSSILQGSIIFILHFLFFPIVRLIWIRKVVGIENIPRDGSVILVFNHQSYFDFIGFMAVTPRPIYYLAAEKFYTRDTNRFWGPILNATGQVRVDRKSKDKDAVYSTVRKILSNDRMLGIFPEGTRVPSSTLMQRGFTGVVKFAISNDTSIIPVGIRGAYDIMSRTDKRPKFNKILEFHIGKPIIVTNNKDILSNKEQLQSMTDSIMHTVATLSNKTYPYGE